MSLTAPPLCVPNYQVDSSNSGVFYKPQSSGGLVRCSNSLAFSLPPPGKYQIAILQNSAAYIAAFLWQAIVYAVQTQGTLSCCRVSFCATAACSIIISSQVYCGPHLSCLQLRAFLAR